MSLLIALHVLAAVIWVGGMFFAYMILRPAVINVVEPMRRPMLWRQTLTLFLRWVWLCIVVLLGTGYGMVFAYMGGMKGIGWHVHLMQGTGLLMILLFLHVWFVPFRRLQKATHGQGNTDAAKHVGQVRTFVGLNLLIGLVTVVVGAGGRYIVL